MIQWVDPVQYSGYDELKTIQPAQLQAHIADGWALLGLFVAATVSSEWVELPWLVTDDCKNQKRAEFNMPMTKNEVCFIVGRAGEVSSMVEKIGDLERRNSEHHEARKANAREMNQQKDAQTQLEERLRALYVEANDLRTQKDKMESDLGRLERQLGAQRMREILAEDSTNDS